MPRPNRPRSLAEEDNLARRMAHEREVRGWTYDGLAKRMTDAGCPTHASALYKVEKADPRRRITVAELVALARVFDLAIDELLLPPEVAADRQAVALVKRWDAATEASWKAADEVSDANDALQAYLRLHPATADAVQAYLHARTNNADYAASFVETLSAEGGDT